MGILLEEGNEMGWGRVGVRDYELMRIDESGGVQGTCLIDY